MSVIYKWVRQNPVGSSGSGDDFANAYTLAQLVTHLAGLGALSTGAHRVFYMCGDFDVTASFKPNVNADNTVQAHFWGMDAASGTVPTQITFDGGGGNFPVISLDSTSTEWLTFRNITAQNTNMTGNNDGFRIGNSVNQCVFIECMAQDVRVGFNSSVGAEDNIFIRCTAKDCSSHGFSLLGVTGHVMTSYCQECAAINNGGAGFSNAYKFTRCLSAFNASYGFGNLFWGIHCTAHGNGASGFKQTQSTHQPILHRCISTSNIGYGVELDNGDCLMNYLATRANTLGRHNMSGPLLDMFDTNQILLSMDPYNDAAGLDFGLNAVETGGALCRNEDGFDFIDGVNVSYHDTGCAQHCCPIPVEQPIGGPWALEYIAASLVHGGKLRS